MCEFRARLRQPMSEIFLGCIVKSVGERISKSQGVTYYHIEFSNTSLLLNWFPSFDEYGVRPEVGDSLNLSVRWERTPYGRGYPRYWFRAWPLFPKESDYHE